LQKNTTMTKQLTLIITFLLSTTLFAQVTNEGKPLSWKLKKDTKSFQTHVLPSIDLKKLQEEDIINDKLAMPFRFGFKHQVDYGFNDGQWTILENGDRIWRIKFQSKDALSLNFIFDKFRLPQGAKLYLYNDNKTDLLGAYTSANNNINNSLGTWIVESDTVWIEYYEPAKVTNQATLHINTITHAYRNAQTAKDLKVLGDSGNCNHDVDCPIGNDWENHKDLNKKSVALILNNGADWCSGALINNTGNNGIPYFLTANHCIQGQNTANWVFRFGWISPNPVCAATTNSTNGPTNMQINGAVVKANNANSDFALLQLNSNIPAAWDRTWTGWDKTDTTPNFVVGIHHPRGDIMKICRDNAGTIPVLSGGVYEWEITTAGGGWEIGVTEGGSSGSPLFNQDGRVIGQLHRGAATCSGTNDNNQYDQYGRFGISWDAISGSSNQLKPWLDPNNTNQNVLDSYPSTQSYTLDAGISITIPNISCGQNQVNPILVLTNNGTTTLTSATLKWNIDFGSLQTINWTGSLAQNTSENISLGTLTLSNGGHDLIANVSSPNGGTDENAINNSANSNIQIKIYETTQVLLNLIPDDYGSETTWTFKNASGTTLYSGGPYTDNNSTPINETFNVPTAQCYVFTINDSSNDGICCGQFGDGSYTLKDDGGGVIFSGGSFNDSESTQIAISTTAAISDYLSKNVVIYPNPTNGNLNIDIHNFSGNYSYILVNTLGQKMQQGNLLNAKNAILVNTLDNGMYFLRIEDTLSKKYLTKKIVISK